MAEHFRYSRWDGSQTGFDLDAYRLFDQMADDLLYHGDVSAALRRLLFEGFELDGDDRRTMGLRELIDRIRQRRQELSESGDLGEPFHQIARGLSEVVDVEREGIDAFERAAAESGDERRVRTASSTAGERRMALDLLPDDLAGKFRSLSAYEFVNPEAARRFAELSEKLRQEVADMYFSQFSQALSATSPEDLARMRQALAALNQMIEQRRDGQPLDPSFEEFMSLYGDLFEGDPTSLEELLEQLAARMAAVQAMLGSMSAAQRAQLTELVDQMLADMDLAWQVSRLAGNLSGLLPEAGWDRGFSLTGSGSLSLPGAASIFEQMGGLEDLENFLTSGLASRPGLNPSQLAEVDMERVRSLLGEDEARSLGRLSEIARALQEAGLIEQREGSLHLTSRGARRIGEDALSEIFNRLSADRLGPHQRSVSGIGHERDHGSKPYEFGDPFNINISGTVRNAIARSGGGVPVAVRSDDMEIDRTESDIRSATVLALDLSLSMPMRDNFLPAKKVAMALQTLISTRYPHDYLGIVTFSEVAREVRPRDLPSVSWDFVYGTNLVHALSLSRRMLNGQSGNKQIIVVTDGEPTAHLDASGEVVFHYPPIPETIEATLAEVLRCTRAGIRINTFALDVEGHLRGFVEKMTSLNRGRAFFTDAANLGSFLLVDFVESRRSARRYRTG